MQPKPGITIWVDDEGLFNNPEGFFQFEGYPQPLAGKGVLLGDDNGKTIGCPLTPEQVTEFVTFHDASTVLTALG